MEPELGREVPAHHARERAVDAEPRGLRRRQRHLFPYIGRRVRRHGFIRGRRSPAKLQERVQRRLHRIQRRREGRPRRRAPQERVLLRGEGRGVRRRALRVPPAPELLELRGGDVRGELRPARVFINRVLVAGAHKRRHGPPAPLFFYVRCLARRGRPHLLERVGRLALCFHRVAFPHHVAPPGAVALRLH